MQQKYIAIPPKQDSQKLQRWHSARHLDDHLVSCIRSVPTAVSLANNRALSAHSPQSHPLRHHQWSNRPKSAHAPGCFTRRVESWIALGSVEAYVLGYLAVECFLSFHKVCRRKYNSTKGSYPLLAWLRAAEKSNEIPLWDNLHIPEDFHVKPHENISSPNGVPCSGFEVSIRFGDSKWLPLHFTLCKSDFV